MWSEYKLLPMSEGTDVLSLLLAYISERVWLKSSEEHHLIEESQQIVPCLIWMTGG